MTDKKDKLDKAYNHGYLEGAKSLNTGSIGPRGTVDDMVRRYSNAEEAIAFRRGYVNGMMDHRRNAQC